MRQGVSQLFGIPLKPYTDDISIMKKIALASILLLLCTTAAGAYSFQFIGPPQNSGSLTGYVGDAIVVEGVSQNIPPGVTLTLRVTGPENYILTRQMVVQNEGRFRTVLETKGLREGDYRFEIQAPDDYPLGSQRNWFMYRLVDRSLLLTITSPLEQNYDGWLTINGRVDELGSGGIELTVSGPAGIYFGPKWVSTDQMGRFFQEIPIDMDGVYSAQIADRKGMIGEVDFQVVREESPIPLTPTPSQAIISASATASRENPAYFVMQTRSGSATISTSLGVDWVIEYIDESGNHHIINEYGADRAETFTIEGDGGTIHIRAYPDGGETGTVHLYGQNVVSLTTSTTASEKFGDLVGPGHTPAEESPAFILMPLIALAILVICLVKKP
jgi:hypothetical protein